GPLDLRVVPDAADRDDVSQYGALLVRYPDLRIQYFDLLVVLGEVLAAVAHRKQHVHRDQHERQEHQPEPHRGFPPMSRRRGCPACTRGVIATTGTWRTVPHRAGSVRSTANRVWSPGNRSSAPRVRCPKVEWSLERMLNRPVPCVNDRAIRPYYF